MFISIFYYQLKTGPTQDICAVQTVGVNISLITNFSSYI